MRALTRLLLVGMLAAVVASVTGCASLTGNALYTYKRTGLHECSLTVDSGRQLPSGYTVGIGGDCSVTGVVPVATQGNATFTIDQALALAQLLGARIPAPAAVPVAPRPPAEAPPAEQLLPVPLLFAPASPAAQPNSTTEPKR